jgi:hypothetical protein
MPVIYSISGTTVSTGPDDGTMNVSAKAFPKSKRHNSTAEAINNLSEATAYDEVGTIFPYSWILSGHGSEGLIETGAGQNGEFNKENVIEIDYLAYWQPLFEKIKENPAKSLKMSSCHTGAGEEGADLLYQIAKIIGKPVLARTGFTYANTITGDDFLPLYSITYEEGSQWQVATPNNRPPAIEAPSKKVSTPTLINNFILYQSETRFSPFKLDAINKIIVKSRNNVNEIEKKDFAYCLSILFQYESFVLTGNLQALVTGSVQIETDNFVYIYYIYNNRLLRATNTNIYYSFNKNIISQFLI